MPAPESAAASASTAQEGRAYTAAADYMVGNNREILALMNRLTTALEHDSVRRSRDLRAIQTGAFVLALGVGLRNTGLLVAPMGAAIPDTAFLFFSLLQFPIYMAPLIVEPLARLIVGRIGRDVAPPPPQ